MKAQTLVTETWYPSRKAEIKVESLDSECDEQGTFCLWQGDVQSGDKSFATFSRCDMGARRLITSVFLLPQSQPHLKFGT